MRFVSTGGRAPPVDFRAALESGLAPDGGLYMPSPLEPLAHEPIESIRGASLPETAYTVLRHVLGDDVPHDALRRITQHALDFPIPLVHLHERVYVLELFHGPTLAFKDVGARCMAGFTTHFRSAGDPPLTVLVATSGDTGGAVAHAFLNLPGIRVVVLYPRHGVSERQSRQFTTLGRNVTALSVDGTFDDCQRMVKDAFADRELRRAVSLTSANSINVGRLIPQIFYYFRAWAQLPEDAGAVVCATPSGNFGNLTAGLMAKRLGAPIARFVAGTNINRVVPDYLETGEFAPRPSLATISNAMDIGNPSNFARILSLYGGNRARLCADLAGSSHTDRETLSCITYTHARHGYVLDPHSAVGYLALRRALAGQPDATGIVLATAHPAKFAEAVEPAIGAPVPVPDRLAASLAGEEHALPVAPRYAALRKVLLDG